ncbi:ABC transporter permease [Patescibacteria group bacterium]|nr:MAG: ABC transporter permease [Patescibacteria group bacterium]
MFLALNELLKEKTRFVLITLVIFLVSYLTFFLTALAYGLATSYTQGIEKWNASGIVLQQDANDNIARSLITEQDYEQFVDENTALLGVGSATIEAQETDDVTLFGIDTADFLRPVTTEGRDIQGAHEVVVSDELKEIGLVLGQEISFKGVPATYTIVGFTDRATFQTAPIVYMQLETWRTTASDLAGMVGMKDETTVSALVTRGLVNTDIYANRALGWQTIRDFSFQLPGYNAQVLTFGMMIGFLIIIASFVLAIFMYILTLQKKSVFGVLKAEGIPSGYIAQSVLAQTIILAGYGMLLGLGLTLLSGVALAGTVPFVVQPVFFAGIAGLFLICAAIGGMASVRTVTKIDPVEAIG